MSVGERATWNDVDQELRTLADTGETFETELSVTNRVGTYEAGRRISLVNPRGTSFVEIESIRECWTKLEKQGSIRRQDVLEPGRCSAFMMALFGRVRGVRREQRDEPYLVLPK